MTGSIEREPSRDIMAPCRFLSDTGVKSFEELENFEEGFPDCGEMLIVATFARHANEKDGVRILGF